MVRLGAAALVLLLGLSLSVAAKDRTEGMSERVFKRIDEVQVLIEAEDYPAALTALDVVLESKLSDYERAHLLNFRGYIWYQQDDLERAIAAYEQALALERLPPSMLVTLRLTLGQVHLVSEDYETAELHLRELLALEDQAIPANKILLGAALIGQERHDEALTPILEAVQGEEANGNVPRENWLSMLSSVYYELNDYPAMRDVIEKLTILYPREQYLMNLAALHGQLGDEQKQLALVESLLDDDRLHQATHLKMIANLYLGADLPYKAATLLDREVTSGRLESNVSNLELLSQAWFMAAETERAIEPLAQAAALSESGELYLRLARLHMDAYDWSSAEAAAEAALDKGGLRQEGQAWLLRGMAEVRLNRFSEARRQFERAKDFDYVEEYATQWLSYVDAERMRLAATETTDDR